MFIGALLSGSKLNDDDDNDDVCVSVCPGR